MSEVLGHRSLLGLGVVVTWLVLFHLLVNIWLLCVFTSLLVVLGGWLGSQAVLESNSVVHLERFITLQQIPSSLEDEEQLNEEIQEMVRKIIRDFVSSWYSAISTESAFEVEVQEAMISMAMELKTRARRVNRKALTQRVLDLYGCHLQNYQRSKELLAEQDESPAMESRIQSNRLWEVYSRVCTPHPAVQSPTVEVNYARAAVDLLLHVLVPPPHLESRTGRFVVGELITCNVILPLLAKVSDPDWLNVLVVQLFTRDQPLGSNADVFVDAWQTPTLPPRPPPTRPELRPQQETPNSGTAKQAKVPLSHVAPQFQADVTDDVEEDETPAGAYDTVDSEFYCPVNNGEEAEEPTHPFLRHYLRSGKSNPFYQENDSDLDSPLGDYKRGSLDSLVMVGQEEGLAEMPRECGTPLEPLEDTSWDLAHGPRPNVLVISEPLDQPGDRGPPTLGMPDNIVQNLEKEDVSAFVNPTRDLLLGLEQMGLGTPIELTAGSPSLASTPLPSFSFEPLSSPEGPVIIQNLRITGTITAKEHRGTGSHPYTLYTIKYETAVGCEGSEDPEAMEAGAESPVPIQPVAYHMVNRRYSEFLNLQTRLEEKHELRKLIKGVKGPKKIFPDMPFGNMDSDKIEARRGLLETFLKQLCSVPEAANSEEMQEFLALNTDARIAFVKKPFIVSRIDKIVVNAIVDTLKTAFPRSEPQSPTEDNEGEVDGGKLLFDKKNKSRLKFSSKNSPYMNGSDVRPQVVFSWDQSSTVFSGMSLVDLETFVRQQERLSSKELGHDSQSRGKDNRAAVESGVCGCAENGTGAKRKPDPASETALAELALNILCLLMRQHWGWLCTENIQKTIRLLFGTLINRWLESGVANLTCTQYWVSYLRIIQEAVWPGGCLPAQPWPRRSQQQKDHTEQQALQCLMGIVPDLVSDMLGSDKYRRSWQTALDSLQDPYINRHLVYCLCNLLLEFLVPEIPEEDFQRSLLQSFSKAKDKASV